MRGGRVAERAIWMAEPKRRRVGSLKASLMKNWGAVSVGYLLGWMTCDSLTLMMSAESRCLVLLGFVSPTKSFGAMSWILPLDKVRAKGSSRRGSCSEQHPRRDLILLYTCEARPETPAACHSVPSQPITKLVVRDMRCGEACSNITNSPDQGRRTAYFLIGVAVLPISRAFAKQNRRLIRPRSISNGTPTTIIIAGQVHRQWSGI